MRYGEDFFKSRPVRLHWAGWETDTYRLQREGWQLSAHQDMARYGMQIALRSPHGDAHAVTQFLPMERLHDMPQFGAVDLGARVIMARDVNMHVNELPRFDAIDAMPQMVPRSSLHKLSDWAHFAPSPLVRNNPIIVPEESVADLMERILKLQQPDRTARIQAALRNPEGYDVRALPEQKFHAQIISFNQRAA